jgi:class 3 adenylate cyclase
MDDSKPYLPQSSVETIQTKMKTSFRKKRRKEPLRRIWSRGLPSLATDTVRMVVATLQIGSIIKGEDDDDEEDEEFNIGQQIQAHIPDIVLNNLNDLIDQKGNILIPNEHVYNRTTLLFLDVSGFTSLTEQYSNDAHLGIDQLTHTLNSYFDKLVSEILIHNGDIYKFAGDAILALWTNEIHGPEQALKCALYLQEKCGAYETDVHVILRLKVALAYGSVRALFIGIDEFKHYILTGDCVKDVNNCEQLCEPGDIIITKAVYEQVQSIGINCEFVPIKDEHDERKDQYIAVKYLGSIDEDHDITKFNHKMVGIGVFSICSSVLKSRFPGLLKKFHLRIPAKTILTFASPSESLRIFFFALEYFQSRNFK